MNAPTAATRLSEEHRRYLRWVPVAVLPCMAVGAWRFGPQVFLQLAVALMVGSVVAFGSDLLRRRRTRKSFWVPALLFILVIPSGLPLWAVALGFGFALIVGREIFGGPGCERFSVPLLGRLFLLLSYPALMTGPCVGSFIVENGTLSVPALTALCAGGVLLLIVRAADPRTLLVVAGLAMATTFLTMHDHMATLDVMFNMIFLAAFFIATDPVISPTGHARFIYAAFIVVVATVLQIFGGGLEGVTVAVLSANALTPWMNRRAIDPKGEHNAATAQG